METIASIAATFQLIEQTITILQQFYQVREAINTAQKTIEDINKQLFSLSNTLKEIECEPDLNRPSILQQLSHIRGIIEELQKVARTMQALQQRRKICRILYTVIKKPRDDARLIDALKRLVDAKTELSIQIEVAHVGITRGVALGIQRIEQVHKGKHRQEFRLERNMVSQDSDQLNGILGFERASMSMQANILDNQSTGNSRQKNLILGGPISLKLLQNMDD
ncbi:hypothetical protein QBC36DRAFT_359535 [Triangularia setosa]|uniref:NACHT-NTPase and P-loop NTPases N-terminal domain-containing protein n=1 Tax=Triangularia setosa TaxID=2587417 RepID=A0AAN6WDB7_9PEZI|nr:hypothetical protein QBC36DRAFT_359535 [Podospora setosa]